jgi:hypothetical protein
MLKQKKDKEHHAEKYDAAVPMAGRETAAAAVTANLVAATADTAVTTATAGVSVKAGCNAPSSANGFADPAARAARSIHSPPATAMMQNYLVPPFGLPGVCRLEPVRFTRRGYNF